MSTNNDYGKSCKILNTCMEAVIHKMLVRMTNREDPDQTASSEAA